MKTLSKNTTAVTHDFNEKKQMHRIFFQKWSPRIQKLSEIEIFQFSTDKAFLLHLKSISKVENGMKNQM